MTTLEILRSRGITVFQSPTDVDEIRVCCPFCPERGETPDTHFRLGINTRTGKGHCFNCGWKSRQSWYALRRLVPDLDIDSISKTHSKTEIAVGPLPRLPQDFMRLTHCYDALDATARNYLLKRGITMEQIRKKKIGVSYFGNYAYRIIFPVWEEKKLRGIVARDFTGTQKPRYLNSHGDKYLYNFRTAPEVVLSEGVFKCLRLERVVGDRVVSAALLGHDITETQLGQLVTGKCRKVILWPDPDSVGRRGIVAVAEKILAFGIRIMVAANITIPADEEKLEVMRQRFDSGLVPYGWGLSQNVRLERNGK